MLLALDIGNTLTDLGVFDGDQLKKTFKFKSNIDRSYDEYRVLFLQYLKEEATSFSFSRVIISSVVPSLTRVWERLCKEVLHLRPLLLGAGLKTGLRISTENPIEVGSDLVADSVGASYLFGHDLFIADLGTANKYIYIDQTGAFAGCAIAPGLTLSLNALVKGTASLPEVSGLITKKVIGRNTSDSMNSGILNGTVYEIQGFHRSFEKEIGRPLQPILTGGNASFVKDLLPEFHYEEWLLLLGLKEIDKKNANIATTLPMGEAVL